MDYFFAFLLSLIPLCLIIIWLVTYSAKKKHQDEFNKLFEHIDCDESEKDALNHAEARAINYITTHHLYHAVDKVTGILGVVYSIGSVLMGYFDPTNVKCPELKTTMISLLALVFVIIALYISPRRSIIQYKESWMKCCKYLMAYQSKASISDDHDGKTITINDVNDIIIKCEESMDCDYD